MLELSFVDDDGVDEEDEMFAKFGEEDGAVVFEVDDDMEPSKTVGFIVSLHSHGSAKVPVPPDGLLTPLVNVNITFLSHLIISRISPISNIISPFDESHPVLHSRPANV